jgi:hypothetical protein
MRGPQVRQIKTVTFLAGLVFDRLDFSEKIAAEDSRLSLLHFQSQHKHRP